MIRIDLYEFDENNPPFESYISHVIPKIGETLTVLDADRRIRVYSVIDINHWVETRPDGYRIQTEVHAYVKNSDGLVESGQAKWP